MPVLFKIVNKWKHCRYRRDRHVLAFPWKSCFHSPWKKVRPVLTSQVAFQRTRPLSGGCAASVIGGDEQCADCANSSVHPHPSRISESEEKVKVVKLRFGSRLWCGFLSGGRRNVKELRRTSATMEKIKQTYLLGVQGIDDHKKYRSKFSRYQYISYHPGYLFLIETNAFKFYEVTISHAVPGRTRRKTVRKCAR